MRRIALLLAITLSGIASGCGNSGAQVDLGPPLTEADYTAAACSDEDLTTFLDGLRKYLIYDHNTDPTDKAIGWWAELTGLSDSASPKVKKSFARTSNALQDLIDSKKGDSRAKALKAVTSAAVGLAEVCGLTSYTLDDKPKKPKKIKPTATAEPEETEDTDTRYGSCAAANRAGHGPYRRGLDAEYSWYQDRDGDGVVCER